MKPDDPPPQPPAFHPPVSTLGGPIAELIAQQMLAPPARPGLLGALQQFEILRVLGGGGMGVVLLARDSAAGRSVAVKMIRPEWVPDPRMVHRFVKEAGHLEKLKHPNVVPVLEVSDRAAGPYFVMPYYERGSLAGRIRPGTPLDSVFVLDVALNIAEGLQFAHRRGIIHRDLKPANILLTGEQGACLADFGLARTLFNDSIMDVERPQWEGTAPYMSPGVAAGDAEDTRCDIYAFGALLYEMLTGDPPYAGRSLEEIRKQILAGPPKPIQERNPAADAGLRAVAEGAMARELRDRYADMSDVLADLRRIKDGKAPRGPRGLARGGMMKRIPAWKALGMVVSVAAALALISFLIVTVEKQRKSRPAVLQTNQPVAQSNQDTSFASRLAAIVSNQMAAPGPARQPANPIPVATNPIPPLPPASNRIPPPVMMIPGAGPGMPLTPPGWHWTVTVLAVQSGMSGSRDGKGADARFKSPGGVAVAGMFLYVADTGNNTIRQISLQDGTVTTLAGLAGSHGSLDSQGSAARFWAPFGIAVDAAHNVYVAEVANGTIRKISSSGQVSTLAGLAGNPGTNDGVGDNAQFRNPWGVAMGRMGTVYVADTSSSTIRKITSAGAVSTLAGLAGNPGFSDGKGNQARFWNPHGVAVYDGRLDPGVQIVLYVADTGNNTIRKITPDGTVSTVAGRAGSPGLADGAPGVSQLRHPQGLAMYPTTMLKVLFIADTDNNAIRVLTTAGVMTTLAVDGDLGHPDAIAVDVFGTIYVADAINNVIRKVSLVNDSAPRSQ